VRTIGTMNADEVPPDDLPGAASPPPHAWDLDTLAARMETDLDAGLVSAESARRLVRHGPNMLAARTRTPWWHVLGRQFLSALIWILLLAAGISFAIGHTVDAVTILMIVALNAVLGFVQEWKAERALAALQSMLSPRCQVVRDGTTRQVDARDVVPGDVVALELGDRVPADLRIVQSTNLATDESSLTGESDQVRKVPEVMPPDTALADQRNMAWMGTLVVFGRGRGVVTATGMRSAFGQIARLTQEVGREPTPLQRKLGRLGRSLGLFACGVAGLIALTGWLLGRDAVDMVLTGISLAVAVVPEGLPAVVTITLALGVRTMAHRHALIRRLPAAEALGAATVICTDKTGTLTKGEMTVKQVWTAARAYEAMGSGYDPAGHFESEGARVEPTKEPALLALLETGQRCGHATIEESDGQWQLSGQPTEGALVVAACKAGLPPPPDGVTRAIEFPFDSTRKRMTIVESRAAEQVALVKGAPEIITARCTRILDGNDERPFTDADRSRALAATARLAGAGLRVLALARRTLPLEAPLTADAVEKDLTLLGLAGLMDPPRMEVPAAIREAQAAGIRVLVVTGDSPETARAVMGQIGLAVAQQVTGLELDEMDDASLARALEVPTVFARTTPAHKLRIVEVLQGAGEIVGMTGDGVNDAPALKRADIGIAMGIRGTEVARGAGDLVLLDDNFASIIHAVEEGRRQFDNIRKFVRYLLSSNTGEVLAIFLNLLLGGPLILLPVQILWMNLVTDGLTALALGAEPASQGTMRRPPRAPREPIIDRHGILEIAGVGAYAALVTLVLYYVYLSGDATQVALAQTVAFTGLIVAEKVNVLNFRSLDLPLRRIGFFSNPWLLAALALTIGLQICAVYVPFLQTALGTHPLRIQDWLLIVAVALPIFIGPEWIKWRRQRHASCEPRPMTK
jgi:Ca2+-transporting ATPase